MIFQCGTNFWALFSTAENLVKSCVKTLKLAEAFVISDATTDLMILCLPLPMVRVPLDETGILFSVVKRSF